MRENFFCQEIFPKFPSRGSRDFPPEIPLGKIWHFFFNFGATGTPKMQIRSTAWPGICKVLFRIKWSYRALFHRNFGYQNFRGPAGGISGGPAQTSENRQIRQDPEVCPPPGFPPDFAISSKFRCFVQISSDRHFFDDFVEISPFRPNFAVSSKFCCRQHNFLFQTCLDPLKIIFGKIYPLEMLFRWWLPVCCSCYCIDIKKNLPLFPFLTRSTLVRLSSCFLTKF